MKKLSDIREHYNKGNLLRSELLDDPYLQFDLWMKQAIDSECLHPTAVNLATVDSQLRPSTRIVLLKEVSDEGFVYFTNYKSQKGSELEQSSFACLNFFWAELERQVRISGEVKKVEPAKSDEYFQSRPRESQLGAWASEQSSLVKTSEDLQARYNELEKQYEGKNIPRPEHWGGYVLMPNKIEFWQGRSNRMHDRYLYTLEANTWKIEQLAP
ncbi:pyridoxamine 5'-phosphate oxidase [Carboxylicivirga sp. N1Y90]|uniref:pyridoxamine 5'-phosphate oxidase n=1 Tax=Carboxylicivirga fragile TaxID=3417571 RepID=UPI003D32DFC7|nr:pyridoxamine 5'-phosphate oxidase [Marinilabiliaceae bacterium N1Y90]